MIFRLFQTEVCKRNPKGTVLPTVEARATSRVSCYCKIEDPPPQKPNRSGVIVNRRCLLQPPCESRERGFIHSIHMIRGSARMASEGHSPAGTAREPARQRRTRSASSGICLVVEPDTRLLGRRSLRCRFRLAASVRHIQIPLQHFNLHHQVDHLVQLLRGCRLSSATFCRG